MLSALSVVFQLQVRNVVVTAIELGNSIVWTAAVAAVALLDGGLVAIAAAFLGVATLTNVAYIVLALRARRSTSGARARSGATCCARACPLASAACSRSATATWTR